MEQIESRNEPIYNSFHSDWVLFYFIFYSHNFEKVIFWLNVLEFSRNRNMSSGNSETSILFLCHFCTLFFSLIAKSVNTSRAGLNRDGNNGTLLFCFQWV